MSDSEPDDAALSSAHLFERISDAVVVLDSDFQCTTCNGAAEAMIGSEEGEIVGKHVWTVFPDLVGTDAQETIETAMETDDAATTERYDADSDRWFEVRVYPESDGVSLFFTDITERKRREREVERYERVLGHLPVGIERADPAGNGEFTFVTDGLVDLFEADSEATLTRYAPGDLYADQRERDALVESLQTYGEVAERTVTFETLTGTTFEGTVTASREEIRGDEYYVTLFERGIEGETHEQGLARADTMFRTAQEAIFVVDLDDDQFRFERANPAFEATVGLEADEIRGDTPTAVFGEDAGEQLRSQFRDCLATREQVECEVVLPEPVPDSCWHLRVAPVRVEGDVVQLVGTMYDVTDHKQLETDLARLEAFVDIAAECITVVDADQRIEYASAGTTQVTGHEPDTLRGRSLLDFVHPDDRDGLETAIGTVLASPSERETHQYRFEQADGSWATVESTIGNHQDTDEIDGIVVLTRDVTEEADREATLEQVTRQFELAVEGANIATWNWDTGAEEVVFTDEWTNTVGLASEVSAFDFALWEDVVHPDDIEAASDTLNAHLDGETERYDQELRLRTEDNEWQWVRTIGTVVDRDADGTVTQATGLHIDIDERKEVQQGLSETTNTLEAIVKASPSAIVIVDPAGEVVLWNRAAEELFGWSKEEVLGEPVPFIPENKPSQFEPVIGQLNSGETIQTVKTRRQTKSGELRDVRLTSTRIDGDEELVGYLGTFQEL